MNTSRPNVDPATDRELSFDEAEAAGLDATGCDGDPRHPYHFSDICSHPWEKRRGVPNGPWGAEVCTACGTWQTTGFEVKR